MTTVQLPNDVFSNAQNQCYDADFERFLKFDPASPESSKTIQQLTPTTPFAQTDFDDPFYSHDNLEENVSFSGPSHDYNMHRQHTSLPTGGLVGLRNLNHPAFPRQSFVSSMRESTDFDFNSFGGGGSSWNTGIPDNDAVYPLADANTLFPSIPSGSNATSSLIIPPPIDGTQMAPDGRPARIYPGVHQEQAALKKKQQLLLQQQEQQQREARQQIIQGMIHQRVQMQAQSQLRRPTVTDLERDIINGVINQKRHSSTASSAEGDTCMGNSDGNVPHYMRTKKDEDDMDEDERLLASEEGKKLSSKERRQLRNKVSARAFRSRRKEYISQLEGEVAVKTAEAEELKRQNRKLTTDNQSLLQCIQTLVAHPAFVDVMPQISKHLAPTAPTAQPASLENAKSSQPQPTRGATQTGTANNAQSCPEMGRLTLQNDPWSSNSYPFTANQPQVYSIFELPQGPAIDQHNLANLCDKYGEPAYSHADCPDDCKPDMPCVDSIATPCIESISGAPFIGTVTSSATEGGTEAATTHRPLSNADHNDPCIALYIDVPRIKALECVQNPAMTKTTTAELRRGINMTPEKRALQLEVVPHDDVQEHQLELFFKKSCARIEAAMKRISPLTAHLKS